MDAPSSATGSYHSPRGLPDHFFDLPDVPLTNLDRTLEARITYTSKECLRIMHLGINHGYALGNLTGVICYVPDLMEYVQNREEQQKQYGNSNPAHTYIDSRRYNSTHRFSLPYNVEQVLRYLTLTERIAGFSTIEPNKYCLFSTRDSINFHGDYAVWTKGKLKSMDDYMSSLEFPPAPESFSQKQKKLLQQAYTDIRDHYYARVTYYREDKEARWLTLEYDSDAEKVMDFLVQKRVIASWNASNSGFAHPSETIAIKFHDSHISYPVAMGRGWKFSEWRGTEVPQTGL